MSRPKGIAVFPLLSLNVPPADAEQTGKSESQEERTAGFRDSSDKTLHQGSTTYWAEPRIVCDWGGADVLKINLLLVEDC
jgi:hypothetical protein